MKKLFFAALVWLLAISTYGQSVDGALKTLTASGTDTYAVTEPLPAAYNAKERFLVRFTNANTGAATLNRSTLGAKSILKADGSALTAGDIEAGGTYLLSYNGTNYQMVGDGGGGGGGSGDVVGPASATNNNFSLFDGTTGKLLKNSSFSSTDAANAITAFGWGNHAGLYRPIGYVPSWSEITSKPTTIAGYGITDFNSLGDARWWLKDGTTDITTPTYVNATNLSFGVVPSGGSNTYFRMGYSDTFTFRIGAETVGSYGTGILLLDNTNLRHILVATAGIRINVGSDATGDFLQRNSSGYQSRLAAVSAGSFLRSGGVATESAWSTVKLPNTISANSIWVANSANTVVELTPTGSQSIRRNSGNTAWEAYTPAAAYTTEEAQDAVGAMVDGSLTYVDGTPLLQRSALTGAITATAGSNSTALGSFTSSALSAAVSDRSRTVTANDAIVQADDGRTIYFDSGSPIVFLIDILTVDTQVGFLNVGAGDVSIQSGTATVSTTVLSTGESAAIIYETTSAPTLLSGGAGGIGDVVGPASATDNAVVRYDATTGKLVQNSAVFIDDNNDIQIGTGTAGTVRQIQAAGTDTDIDVQFYAKGAGTFRTNKSEVIQSDAGTNNAVELRTIQRQSSGTVAAGFGVIDAIRLENAAGAVGVASKWTYTYSDPTNAAEVSAAKLTTRHTGGEIDMINVDGNKLGLFAATPVVKQSAVTTQQGIADALTAYGLLPTSTIASGYSINVQALTSSPADASTIYFGMLPKAPTTTANISKVYIRKSGTIKIAELYCYSGTAGSNESWSLYIRLNNTTDTLIGTVAASASERVFSNTGLSIAVSAGDYIEIKSVNPTWGTNPLTTIFGGYIYIE